MKRTKSIAPGTGKAARKNFPGPHPNSRQLHTTRVCRSCGQKFSAATSTSEYCSRKCYQHDYYQRNKPQILDKRNKRERAEEPAIPPVDSDMISVRETARRLGICRQTIYNLAAKGIITIYHVTGRLSYVSWSEACATISTRTAPAIQQKPRRSTRKKHPEQTAETSSKAAVPAPPTAAKWAAAQELCSRYGWDTAYLYRFVQCHRISRIKDGRYSLYSIPQIEAVIQEKQTQIVPAGYITIDDAAKKYSVPPSTVTYRLAHYGIDTQKTVIDGRRKVIFSEAAFRQATQGKKH